jgi:hypothetical protein
MNHAAHSGWLLGRCAEARDFLNRSQEQAEKLDHKFSLAIIYAQITFFYQRCGDAEKVEHYADMLTELADKEEFPHWAPVGRLMKGWCLACKDQSPVGIQLITDGISAYKNTGARSHLPHFACILGDALIKHRRYQEALLALEAGAEQAKLSKELVDMPEVERLKGVAAFFWGASGRNKAAESFRESLATAERQQSVIGELRTSMSLVQYKLDPDGVARRRLRQLYDRCQGGSETPVLREAQALLSSLLG